MARDLIDLLWRDHPGAPPGGARGPRGRATTSDVVDAAVGLADAEGLPAVTVRRVAAEVGVAPMSVYTYVGSHEDLLVLMADAVLAAAASAPSLRASYATGPWRDRVTRVAEANLALGTRHRWLLDVTDQRTALGPGAIAKYDAELAALEPLGLDDVDRDAALTFVLDFAWSAARARRGAASAERMAAEWASSGERLAAYLGERHPLAQRVGAAAGEAQQAAYSPEHAWRFGLARVLAGLAALAPADDGV
ncbi:TetR/AcrR family transcriptional regulator [Luteimicrobium sp. NPDC057192]|uniref:TetR/AcrR family transcriptional regulator n=1 Tax=Luteimicrobium sp. NPDC057192 TaxID=3346042 RepID=UPI00363194A4